MFLESKNCCTVKAVCMCIVMSEHLVVRAPSVLVASASRAN